MRTMVRAQNRADSGRQADEPTHLAAARTDDAEEASQAGPRRRSRSHAKKSIREKAEVGPIDTDLSHVADLSYNEARTALDLALSELQASNLDVESMVGLYRRAECYADRCEQLLRGVEQEILLLNVDNESVTPTPYTP